VKDKWGIPVLRFHWKWSEHETKQAAHAVKTLLEVVDRMGGVPTPGIQTDGAKAISAGGEIIHEVGTVRMGDDRQTSVLNKFCQSHDVRNLFVADAAPFVSNADKNPTHTIVALAWRTAEYLAEELRKANV